MFWSDRLVQRVVRHSMLPSAAFALLLVVAGLASAAPANSTPATPAIKAPAQAPAKPAPQPSVESLPAAARNSVVRIVNPLPDGVCLGTGTVVGQQDQVALVLTCAHLFTDGVDELLILSPTGKARPALLLAQDAKNDLACLITSPREGEGVAVAGRLPRIGTPLASCGFGQEGIFGVNRGKHRGYVTLDGGAPEGVLELSGLARQGDSGGPIFNARGELVGVIMGTDGATVDGTHCEQVQTFLAQNPITAEKRAELADLRARPRSRMARAFRPLFSASDELAIATTLEGRVQFNREPASEARVRLIGATIREIKADAQGRFRFLKLPTGRYRLEVEQVIHNRVRTAVRDVVVSPRESAEPLEFDLE